MKLKTLLFWIGVAVATYTIVAKLTGASIVNSTFISITAIIGAIVVILIIIGVVSEIRSEASRRSLEARISDNTIIHSDYAAEYPGPIEGHAALATEDLRLKEYRTKQDEAESELRPYLPPNPRRAKRLINHQRLYVQIAKEREIFGGKPEINYSHLAKWILIVEHWPRLGASLTRAPHRMEILEKCGSVEDLQKELKRIDPNIRATDEMLSVLGNAVPLSPILDRLVRFEPSASSAPGATSPAASAPEASGIDIFDAALASPGEDDQIGEVPGAVR